MNTRRCLHPERERRPFNSCASGQLAMHAPDEDSVAMRWEGGGLRGRLPDLSGASRPGKGPPLACSIAVRVSSSESTMICASVWCPVQYTAFRSRSTNGVGRETVTRCLAAWIRGRAGFGRPTPLMPLLEEMMSCIRVVVIRDTLSGHDHPQRQRGCVNLPDIWPAKGWTCLRDYHVHVGPHRPSRTSTPKSAQRSRRATLQKSALESSGTPLATPIEPCQDHEAGHG